MMLFKAPHIHNTFFFEQSLARIELKGAATLFWERKVQMWSSHIQYPGKFSCYDIFIIIMLITDALQRDIGFGVTLVLYEGPKIIFTNLVPSCIKTTTVLSQHIFAVWQCDLWSRTCRRHHPAEACSKGWWFLSLNICRYSTPKEKQRNR